MSKFDVTTHFLVPKHELLSPEEAKKLLETHSIKKENLPKIKRNDPAIANLGAKPGDIVKIERNSPLAGKIYYYRLVE